MTLVILDACRGSCDAKMNELTSFYKNRAKEIRRVESWLRSVSYVFSS